eukprot:9965702-Alexandrium_andersonii.AAC.1
MAGCTLPVVDATSLKGIGTPEAASDMEMDNDDDEDDAAPTISVDQALQPCIPKFIAGILKRLVFVKAPRILIATVLLTLLAHPCTTWIDGLETFAGSHAVTRSLRASGL